MSPSKASPHILAVLGAVGALIGLTVAAQARPLQSSDFQRLVGLSAPTISRDGKRAAVVVSRIKWDDDSYSTDIDLIDLASHAKRTLTHTRHDVDAPAFSPDGTKLAFLADEGSGDDAQVQIWIMPLNGGDAKPVTSAGAGVQEFSWRPDGASLAYAAADAKPKRSGADRFRDSFVFTTESIVAHAMPRPAHVFVISAEGGKPKQLTFGDPSASNLTWSHDGTTLAFTVNPNAILNDSFNSHIELVDVTSGKQSRLTDHDLYESNPLYSPDGKHIAYAFSQGDSQSTQVEAYVTTPAGGDGASISGACDCYVNDAAWLPDSSGLLIAANEHTSGIIRKLALDGTGANVDLGDVRVVSALEGAIALDGSMVFVGNSVKQPSELYHRTKDGVAVKVTDYNHDIAQLDLADAQAIEYPTTIGTKGDALLYTPPGFDPHHAYPLVLKIHGGPTSASVRGFDEFAQLMAARGWLVLEPNYRGSTNLGLAYLRSVLYDPEEGPGADIMAAVNAVRARGFVDDRRIAVSGWSYGGIMTAWMISKYHIWSAAVSGASVNDWVTDYGVADDSEADVALFHGSPYVAGNAAEWRSASAISYAALVTTPVLILSDVGDNRDPFATSSMYWRALRDNNKDATLRVWPVPGHFPADPVRTLDIYEHWMDYIADHFGRL
jgi:dipeptidyl aminopeptidase/acylaminoacyl peptidase